MSDEFTESQKGYLIRHLLRGGKKTVEVADRREELIELKLKEEEGPFEFYGHNCNSGGYSRYEGEYSDSDDAPKCNGWDGSSRRCECGNRRVSWEYDEKGDYIYAEAY